MGPIPPLIPPHLGSKPQKKSLTLCPSSESAGS